MKSFLCLALAASLTACAAPRAKVLQRGVHGTVVDARTHQPISGATIRILPPFESLPAGSWLTNDLASASSLPDGSFLVPAHLISEPFASGARKELPNHLTVSKPGYLEYRAELPFVQSGNNRSTAQEASVIFLKPLAR